MAVKTLIVLLSAIFLLSVESAKPKFDFMSAFGPVSGLMPGGSKNSTNETSSGGMPDIGALSGQFTNMLPGASGSTTTAAPEAGTTAAAEAATTAAAETPARKRRAYEEYGVPKEVGQYIPAGNPFEQKSKHHY